MSFDWDGVMELFSGKYRPSWTSRCSGSDVKGIMELATNKYKPLPNAHGICSESDISALTRKMVKRDDESKYFPRVVLNDEEMCCAGGSCGECDELLWDSGETPKKVQVVVSGVDWESSGCGDADPNGTYNLTQEEDHPCRWYAGSGIFGIYYQSYSQFPCQPHGMSSCVHMRSNTHWYFRNCANYCGLEGQIYHNLDIAVTDCCGASTRVGGCDFSGTTHASAAFGGQAEVTWPIPA